MPPIIRIENIGKRYIISHEKPEHYQRFSELLLSPFRRRKDSGGQEEFWALKDIDFEIEQGDRVGIIGRNGAGKSTLLKVLSKITVPTTGKISVNGRIASLLEVGTGFHPELSGRENIYLNGAILGMKHAEVKKKFDEIVDFAGVEKFLDTPVKRYSSGMYVRLAFAVAAHLEPEILVIDEVLAVGDAEFQKKCLGKMDDISKTQGRTILFVSHNMTAIKQLCNRGVFLNDGQISREGTVDECIAFYQNQVLEAKSGDFSNIRRAIGGSGLMKWTNIEFYDEFGQETHPTTGKFLCIRLKFETKEKILRNCRLGLRVNNLLSPMFLLANEASYRERIDISSDTILECCIPRLPLLEGRYLVTLFCEVNGVIADWIHEIPLHVESGLFWENAKNAPSGDSWENMPLIDHSWRIRTE